MKYDVVVIGAGHAGCEAAAIAARLGVQVGLVSLCSQSIAKMSCNPAIGGVGKGHLVREIDALGGLMGQIADATGIQYKTLNRRRGSAVRSTRCQSDSTLYSEAMTQRIAQFSNIEFIEAEVVGFQSNHGALCGLLLRDGQIIHCQAAIVTTGTFLNGLCHVGDEQFAGGRIGAPAATGLSAALRGLGLQIGRFKTGTTPRLHRDSICFDALDEQCGEQPRPRFSVDKVDNPLRQVSCYLTRTNAATHAIISENLHRSPLYTGIIQGLGPRYCPSLEDKVVRFADKDGHTVFLEPEGLDSDRVYPNGLSTSLPKDVQESFLRTIPGLENVKVIQHGYAVEYDYVPPTQLHISLMTKVLPGLFLAGQINGTSGYEEAAAQGLMAGINAYRYIQAQEPAIIGRHQGYIGVLIDDLVTKGVDEPYRMFTSRAEHRLTLREANAEHRLLQTAMDWGTLPAIRVEQALERRHFASQLQQFLETTKVGRELAAKLSLSVSDTSGMMRSTLLRRPEISLSMMCEGNGWTDDLLVALAWVEEEIKFEGYIQREQSSIHRLQELENMRLPSSVNYKDASGLSLELQEKLNAVRPLSLGQASRIPGMTPAALTLLRFNAHRWVHKPAACS